jgi:hypothetical protein
MLNIFYDIKYLAFSLNADFDGLGVFAKVLGGRGDVSRRVGERVGREKLL